MFWHFCVGMCCAIGLACRSSLAERREVVSEPALIAGGLLGSYRRDNGWGKVAGRGAHTDPSYRVLFQAR